MDELDFYTGGARLARSIESKGHKKGLKNW